MAPNIATWRKASYSSGNGGNCVELARLGNTIAIRDSKNPDGPKLVLTPRALHDLTRVLKNS
ncbi:DUF397 domain-containing protein [Actinomadura decatromicini]|uniref:DUF397 domain-containing protein n=1 Tax=Actinomadura decatromicini TaxID=2604572 RepID=A0A5D3FNZ2_9ACTN|nr:DUF397 domain-containing protein [Actinomadura decatromicini]TYK49380.1 DUF397 domain-containing protein [Actinomadura decatromicini]